MVTSETKPIIPVMTSSKRKGTFYHHPTMTTKVDIRFYSTLLLFHLLHKVTLSVATGYNIGI